MSAITLPGVGTVDFGKMQNDYNKWLQKQPVAIEASLTGLQASAQGLVIGYIFGQVGSMDPNANDPKANPAISAQFKALQAGGPMQQALNLGVLMGVNAGLSLAIKRIRKGKEDVWGAMAASFGSGAAYSLVSGAPNPLQAAVTTGLAFAAFNGIFYQLGNMFKSDPVVELEYERGKYLLKNLGLTKFTENLKKGLLTDQTIMLWNDSALAEAKVPAGPRLLILHHLDQYRNPSSVLKPALPLPPLPPMAPPAATA